MKKVSIIVPVYNQEKYISMCLDSLVNQTLKDIEIVIINDGSKDKTEEKIKPYIEKYKDKIVYKKIPNGGVANARNTGLKIATGEYIGFVDSDDFIALDMYEKLYSKTKENNADITVSGYFFDYENGTFKNYELDEESLFSKSIHESKEILLNTTPFITNKIFKRSFIEENNFYFEKYRIFEDLLFTYKAFLKANKIDKVNECFYHYCRRKGESVTGGFTNKFEDIFEAGNKLRTYYKTQGGEDLIEYINYIIIKHIYLRFNARISIKEIKYKHSFIKKSIKYLNKEIPNWKTNMYFDIYKNRSTNGFISIVRPYNNKIKNTIKKIAKKINSPGPVYKKYYNTKIDNNKIYLYSQKGNDINGNMFYLLKELRKDKKYDKYQIYIPVKKNRIKEFKTKIDKYNIKNYNLIIDNTKKSAKILSKSKYIFTDTSLEIYYIKKEGQIYINTWHGTPLKTLGKAVASDYYGISNVQKNFMIADYLLYPNEYMKDIMMRDYMLHIKKQNICMLGYPRNSIFFEKTKEEAKMKIAYLPTWRGANLGTNSKSYLEQLEQILEEIDENLDKNCDFYINLHPYLKGKIDFDKYKNIKQIPKEYETYDFLNKCDVLVTDYSSVFFDYATTRKNIILFTYDKEEYLKDRGMYLDIDTLPFKQVQTVKDLINEIKKPYKFNYNNFIKTYCNYDTENNAKNLLELAITGNTKNINLITEPKDIKEATLFHSNSFIIGEDQNEITEVIETLSKNNDIYLSFLNRKIKNNKQFLKKRNKDYFGYFGYFSLNSLFDTVMIKLLNKKSNFYDKFKNYYDNILSLEYKRRYQNIKLKQIILYKERNKLDIYTFAFANTKKVIYFAKNVNLNKNLLNKYDEIYVKDESLKQKFIRKGINKNKIIIGNIVKKEDK